MFSIVNQLLVVFFNRIFFLHEIDESTHIITKRFERKIIIPFKLAYVDSLLNFFS